jgi:hypothetical protein
MEQPVNAPRPVELKAGLPDDFSGNAEDAARWLLAISAYNFSLTLPSSCVSSCYTPSAHYKLFSMQTSVTPNGFESNARVSAHC